MSDYDKNIEPFLEGELNIDDIQPGSNNNSGTDFIEAYKIVIDKSKNEQTPDFNPFEKRDSARRKEHLNVLKRLLPYAAILLILVGIFSAFIISKSQQKIENSEFSEQQIAEIQENTEYALLYFSKEFNRSLKKIEDAKQMSQPFEEIQKLKNVKIEFNNPLKNLKFN